MSSEELQGLFVRDARTNAAVVWLLVVLLVAAAAVAVLDGDVPGAALAAVAAFVAVAPALAGRRWTATVPWPMLLLASLPLLFSAVGPTLGTVFVTGLSVAALGMLVVVALQLLTTVRMTPNFAVFFVTIVTLATAGFWAVGAAVSARFLGTPFVETNDELMWIFSAATLAGLLAGGVFLAYFNRRLRANADRRSGGEAA